MEPTVVHFEGEAVIHLLDDVARVTVELKAGRDRHSVGGQIAEGPRWWVGRVAWETRPLSRDIEPGSVICIELSNGRVADAVVEDTSPDPVPDAAIRGLGPPPFEVP